jgi:hypothetical protein
VILFFLVPPCWPVADPLRSMSEVDEEPMPISRHTGLCVIWADLPRSSWCLLHHQRCLFPLVPLRWLNMRIWYRNVSICVYDYINITSYNIIEGSLEVKLPTIWTVEKQRWEESEETRSEERRCRCAKR